MSNKFSRRNFLRGFAATGAVLSAGGASLALTNIQQQATWDELLDKSQKADLTPAEAALLGSYINRSEDPARVMKSWDKLADRSRPVVNLFKVHPHIEAKMVAVARNKCGPWRDTEGARLEPTYCDKFPGA